MSGYALLLLPSANRVYADAATELTLAELELFNRSVCGGRLASLAVETIGNVPYVTFTGPLEPADLAFLANASAAYALFERVDDLLRPVTLTRLDRFDDDLVTIPKYAGKTNEQFTKLLLNATVLSSAVAPQMLTRRLRVLDPLCGRGTTLSQALTYGYDAAGLDLDGKDFDAYAAFLPTYLKRKRLKHKVEAGPVRRERRIIAKRMKIDLTATRDAEPQTVDVVCADTVTAGQFFKPASFDVIVTDAPYGVQHGSRTIAQGLRRSPLELLGEAAPVWAPLLRPGGALGIAINTLVAPRERVAEVLTGAGLRVCSDGPYAGFRHRVDQAIVRDIVIAQRPGTAKR